MTKINGKKTIKEWNWKKMRIFVSVLSVSLAEGVKK